jgi:di/tricarboxylate transporter
MPGQISIAIAILVVAGVLLVSERLRADLVALLVVVALGFSGLLTPREAFSGLSSSAAVTITAVFVLTEALRVSGVTEQAGRLLLRLAGGGEGRLVAAVMAGGALLSLFMNNIAAAAVLMPAVLGAARRARVRPARLLMPMAFGTILGGMATLFTTTNIVVSGLLRGQDLPGFGVLDFAPVGLPMAIAGIAYMALWGHRWLPKGGAIEGEPAAIGPELDLVEIYRLHERLFSVRVPAGSALAGKSLAACDLRGRCNLNVVAIERDGRFMPAPAPDVVLQAGDVLLVEGRLEEFQSGPATSELELLPSRTWTRRDLESRSIGLAEVLLAPRSNLLGQTLRAARLREKYQLAVLGIWRAGRPIRTGLSDAVLQFGDALLVHGPWASLQLLRGEPDLIVLDGGREAPAAATPAKARLALGIMALAVVLAAANSALVGEIMLAAALLVVLTGVLTIDQAYLAIEWRSVFLVAGMLPLGLAMTKSGAAAFLADHFMAWLGPAGPLAVLAGLFALTTLLTQIMNGSAVAAIVAPIAIRAAGQAGMDPRALAMGVALATSMAFLTPLGHPVNVLVMGPGGYRFRDYLRVGWPMTLLLFGVAMALLPVFWPLAAR